MISAERGNAKVREKRPVALWNETTQSPRRKITYDVTILIAMCYVSSCFLPLTRMWYHNESRFSHIDPSYAIHLILRTVKK
jgi:hypothetical protein